MTNKRFICASFVLPVFLFFSFLNTTCDAEEYPTVRIGVIEEKEDVFFHRDGQRTANKMVLDYMRDYFEELSKQTHWQYKFVTDTPENIKKMFARGDVDLIGPLLESITEDKSLVFSEGYLCYGIVSLYGKKANPRIYTENSKTISGVPIGVPEDEALVYEFSHWAYTNNWIPNVKTYSTAEEMLAALDRGEVVGVVDDGTHMTDDEVRIASINVMPFQMAVLPKQKPLMEELNRAVFNSEKLNPGFETWLEREYVDKALYSIARYTEKERKFIAKAPTLNVTIFKEAQPLFSLHGNHGVYGDLINTISKECHLSFDFLEANTPSESIEMLRSGKADLAFVVYGFSPMWQSFFFTNRVTQEAFTWVIKPATDMKEVKRIAYPLVFPGLDLYLAKMCEGATFKRYDTLEECLDRVENGDMDAAFVPSLSLRYKDSLALRPSLVKDDNNIVWVPVCIAISPKQPQILQKTLSTAIMRLPEGEFLKLVAKNSVPPLSLGFVLSRHPLMTTLVVALVFLILSTALFLIYRIRMQREKNRVLSKKNRDLELALDATRKMRESRDAYRRTSELDRLTGLINKVTMEQMANSRLSLLNSSGEEKTMALFIMDMDHFKEANDTKGHQFGDMLLINFAKGLKEIFTGSDAISRFGGDEFVVLTSPRENGREFVREKAEEVLSLAKNLTIDGKSAEVTASIGIALAPADGADYETIFSAADKALYRVKNGGRNGFSLSNEGEICRTEDKGKETPSEESP